MKKMMTDKKTFATFESRLAEDAVWDKDGKLIEPGGRTLLSWICQGLRERRWKCGDPGRHSFYGWTAVVTTGSGTAQLIVQCPGPWLLIVTNRPSLWRRLRGVPDDDVDDGLLKAVQEILAAGQDTVSNVMWHTRGEYSAGAAP